MKKFWLFLIMITLCLPNLSYAYMDVEKAATTVKKVVEGKMSAWAIRDSRVKVKKRPILSKRAMAQMVEGRTKVDVTPVPEVTGKKIVDLRKFDSPIKNQGDRGWCTAFANVAVMENYANQAGKPVVLSEIYLWNLYHEYDMYMATDAASKNFIIQSKDWPYRSEKPVVKDVKTRGVAKIKAYEQVTSISDAMAALDKNEPVVFAVETNSYWGSPNHGVLSMKGEKEGGHALAIVGYYYDPDNKDMGGGFLIFKNSWDKDWGDNGYGYLPFKYCTIYDCYFLKTEGLELK